MEDLIPKYVIIQADGIYPDNTIENEIFSPRHNQKYEVEYVQTMLSPEGHTQAKPWSTIPKELRERVQGITMLKTSFSAEDVKLFPSLKVIIRMGVGYDRVDRRALAKHGIVLANIPDYGTCEIADHTLALALSIRRGVILHHDTQRESTPAPWTYITSPVIKRIQRETFGILGLGRIGIATAMRAKAFGWNVLFYDPYLPNGLEKSLDIQRTRSIEDIFKRSTILSLHFPATKKTNGLVNYDLLKLMPEGSIFINTARGEIADLDGVERALRENILAGAGLDVLPNEPIPIHNVHPLIQAYRNQEKWLQGRLIITPHTAWYTEASFQDVRTKTAETMRDILIDGLRTNVIEPDRD